MAAILAQPVARAAARTFLRTIVVLAGLAMVLRIGALVLQGPTAVEGDAANYARIAQNFHDGVGNVTIRGVPNVLHAPLYPLLMAALLFVVRSPEAAGIAISLAAGTLLVVMIYRLTAAIADARSATVAGILAALHPILIGASIVGLSECLFMALVFTGLDALVRALQRASYGRMAFAGVCFGGAYVTREEGLAYAAIGAVAVIVASLYARPSPRIIAAQLLALLVPFAICAAPYVAFLTNVTGHVVFEAKSASNLSIAMQMRRGSSYLAAADAIGPNLQDVGVEMGPSYPFSDARVDVPPAGTRLRLALQRAPQHLVDLLRVLGAKHNGTPLFLVFALIGAVWQMRSRSLGYGLILVACLLAEFAALLSIYHFWDRYAVPFAALLIPWTGCGIVVVARWAGQKLVRTPPARLAAAGWTLAFLVGLSWYAITVRDLRLYAEDPTLYRDAGAWISTHGPHRAVVMTADYSTAYYSDGTARALPYAAGRTALRYIDSRAPNFVVVSSRDMDRPYLRAWVSGGVPDVAARKVFEEHRGADVIAVYRWVL
jgi:4-amino-4-deoxy-L-arabinose transferase-like glycosyltransferase